MRTFISEFAHDYQTYSFGYTIHAALEEGDTPSALYAAGFLPYSADPNAHNVLYMARSVRVRVREFAPTSENRRVLRKFDGLMKSEYVKREALSTDATFQQLFLTYFATRHGTQVMGPERLGYILNTALPLRGVRYTDKNGNLTAAVFETIEPSFAHFWFPAYDPAYLGTSFGMWLMIDSVRRAAAEGRSYVYLGTAYGEKARYKLNIPALEFWDGEYFNPSILQLRACMQKDLEHTAPLGTLFTLPRETKNRM